MELMLGAKFEQRTESCALFCLFCVVIACLLCLFECLYKSGVPVQHRGFEKLLTYSTRLYSPYSSLKNSVLYSTRLYSTSGVTRLRLHQDHHHH